MEGEQLFYLYSIRTGRNITFEANFSWGSRSPVPPMARPHHISWLRFLSPCRAVDLILPLFSRPGIAPLPSAGGISPYCRRHRHTRRFILVHMIFPTSFLASIVNTLLSLPTVVGNCHLQLHFLAGPLGRFTAFHPDGHHPRARRSCHSHCRLDDECHPILERICR